MALFIGQIFFVIFLFWMFRSVSRNNKLSSIPLFLTFFMFFIFHIYRGLLVGADTIPYFRHYFNSTFDFILSEQMNLQGEFLFRFYLVFVRTNFGEDLFWMNFGVAIIILPGFYYFIKRHSKNYFLSCLIFILAYYFAQSMNVTRQYIAVMICMYAFEGLSKKKYLRFVVLVLVAHLFHAASGMFLLLLIPTLITIPKMRMSLMIVALAVFAVGSYVILPDVLRFINPPFLNHDRFEGGFQTALANAGLILISALCLMILAKKNQKMREHYLYFCLLLMALISGALAFRVHLFSRFAMWFLVYQIIIVPNYFTTKIRTRGEFYFRIMILGYFVFYWFFAMYRNSAYILVDGSFIWQFPW